MLRCVLAVFILGALVAQAAKVIVTAIGDSITEGAGCRDATNTEPVPSYTVALQSLLGDGVTVVNAGASGMTQLKEGRCFAPPKLDKCSYRDTEAWQRALESKGDIFTIMLGTNDAKDFNWEAQITSGDFFAVDYIDMVQQLARLQPAPKAIFVMIPPPLFTNSTGGYVYHMDPHVINNVFPKLVPEIARVAGKNVVTGVIDVQGAILKSPLADPNSDTHLQLTCDGCHPTQAANDLIAQAMAPRIQDIAKTF